MAIKFHFAGDKSIGVGSKPAGAFSIFKPPVSVPSNPEAGTVLDTYYSFAYPVSEGGAYIYVSEIDYNAPIQTCTVDIVADGNGGEYIDWATVRDIANVSDGTTIAQQTGVEYSMEVPDMSGNYYVAGTQDVNFIWDEMNTSYYGSGSEVSWYSNGTQIGIVEDVYVEVPSGSGSYYDAGAKNVYYWSGDGSYYTANDGNWYTGFITSDGSYDYYWSGDGGYYEEMAGGGGY